MTRWPVIAGGRVRQTLAQSSRPTYRIATNTFGVDFVYFGWSPSANVLDCVMGLAEAVARGLVVSPSARAIRLVQAVAR